MASNKTYQCELCSSVRTDGCSEMMDPLLEQRVKVCHECGIELLRIQRALADDDVLESGLFRRAFN